MRRKHAILLTLWLAVGAAGWLALAPSLFVARSADKVYATLPGERAAPPEFFDAPEPFPSPTPFKPGARTNERTAENHSEAVQLDPPKVAEEQPRASGWGMSGVGVGGGGGATGGIGLGNIGAIGKGSGSGSGGFGSGAGKNSSPSRGPASASPSPSPPAYASAPGGGASAPPKPITPQTIDDILAALPIGSIAFNTPEEIPLGESAVIELLLSMTEPEASLADGVRGPGPIETARVRFGNLMQAELSGLGFDIEPITPEQQAVSQSERTRWKWQIRPTETDAQPLHLTLSAQVRVDGERLARTIETFEREIRVRVPLVRRVTDFVSGHTEMFFSLLLAPLAAAGWKRWRSQRAKQLTSESAEATPAPEPPAHRAA